MKNLNHLKDETSPYLLQHAENPVDWYPWGEQALQKARQENKPILLSIGYAACHWCHVMAHESFSDPQTAELMNQWFINIKVDREERPDLDKIYQTTHQLLTSRAGGWPLTVFLTPDKQIPFYAGTYFPPEESAGRPAFKTILAEVAHFYYARRDAIERLDQAITAALATIAAASWRGVELTEAPLTAARTELEKGFDFIHGGFGRAPKFPLSTHLNFLLENAYFSESGDAQALNMLDHSLQRMAQGGLFDQLGGGFFRYCIDSNWQIPHFEKMLYDNAQLIPIYAQRALIKKDNFFSETALATLDWALRELRAPQGGFYASLNADSEGMEGKYYRWQRDEIRNIITPLEYSAVAGHFGLNKPPNFDGHWHLFIAEQDKTIHGEWLPAVKQKLLAEREQRIHPSCDKKILTAWNALMIKALVKASCLGQRSRWADAAELALEFIHANLWKEQRLLAVWSSGHAHLRGYLDDYAFLLDVLIEFLQIRWREDYWQWALTLADQLMQYFYDAEHGGFFYTAVDHESLIQRPKIFADESLPSGNGVAAACFLRLGYWLDERRYLECAEKTLQAGWEQMNLQPSAHMTLLAALRTYFHPPVLIILRGDPLHMTEWYEEFSHYYLPDHYCYRLNSVENLPAPLQKPLPEKGVCAYICRGHVCLDAIKDLSEFSKILSLAARTVKS